MKSVTRLIDVRQGFEFASAHISGAEHVPLSQLSSVCRSWPRAEPLLLICKSGHRAQLAHRQLSALGFTQLTVLAGGMDAWKAAGKPVERIAGHAGSVVRRLRIGIGLLMVVIAFTLLRQAHYAMIATALVGAIVTLTTAMEKHA